MIYEYKDLKNRIKKVGDTVRAVRGKHNACSEINDNGSNTEKITHVNDEKFFINGCWYRYVNNSFLEIVNEKKSLDNFDVGDIIVLDYGKAKVLAKLGDVFLASEFNDFDSTRGWYTIAEAKKYGWTIEDFTPPEEVVMTIPELEEKLGIKNLKIKK